jgi:type IV pilus assembly protein PilP
MMQKPRTRFVVWLTLAAAIMGLSACTDTSDELREYIDEVKTRPGGRIDPLPTPRPAPSFVYEAGQRRSPFIPDAPENLVSARADGVPGPDPNRPREHLEQFPLDSFRMVGTLEMGGRRAGLVQGADGLVHDVTIGQYIGQNYGRIVNVTDSEIQLVEIISDSLGGYIERPTSIGLSD